MYYKYNINESKITNSTMGENFLTPREKKFAECGAVLYNRIGYVVSLKWSS